MTERAHLTSDEAMDLYMQEIDKRHGAEFAATVGRFQEGFLADGVTDDLDEAFRGGVDTARRLLPAIQGIAKAGQAAR